MLPIVWRSRHSVRYEWPRDSLAPMIYAIGKNVRPSATSRSRSRSLPHKNAKETETTLDRDDSKESGCRLE